VLPNTQRLQTPIIFVVQTTIFSFSKMGLFLTIIITGVPQFCADNKEDIFSARHFSYFFPAVCAKVYRNTSPNVIYSC